MTYLTQKESLFFLALICYIFAFFYVTSHKHFFFFINLIPINFINNTLRDCPFLMLRKDMAKCVPCTYTFITLYILCILISSCRLSRLNRLRRYMHVYKRQYCSDEDILQMFICFCLHFSASPLSSLVQQMQDHIHSFFLLFYSEAGHKMCPSNQIVIGFA